jgi:hypothetical protein
MRRVVSVRSIVLAGLVVGLAAPAAAAEKLAGDDLKQAVAGKQIFLATPFGGEFPLNYRANGVVDGSGKAIGLGKWMQPTDSGRWWVDGSKLCQKWTNWCDGKQFCFTVTSQGPKKISWVRDDGLSGTARVED